MYKIIENVWNEIQMQSKQWGKNVLEISFLRHQIKITYSKFYKLRLNFCKFKNPLLALEILLYKLYVVLIILFLALKSFTA